MSTYSSNLRIELITTGTQAGTWGNTTNDNYQYILEQAIAGNVAVSVTSANQALTYLNGPTSTASANESVRAILTLSTTTTAAFAVYAPPVSKQYTIYNSSAYTATIYNSTAIGNTTAAGTGVAIPAGKIMTVWSDGTNFYEQNTRLNAPDLGTPSAGVMTNVTGLPLTSGVTGTLPVANGGTGVTTSTGTGSVVLSASPALTGTPTAPTAAFGTNTTQVATTAFVQAAGLTGEIKMWGVASAPAGYLLCDGAAVSRTTYAALFAVYGTTFGAGDGSTTFNLPNFKDRMPIGAGNSYALAATGGSATTTISASNLPPHTHSITDPGHFHTITTLYNGGAYTQAFPGASGGTQNNPATSTATTGITATNNTQAGGTAFSNTAMNTISPYLGVYFIIKY